MKFYLRGLKHLFMLHDPFDAKLTWVFDCHLSIKIITLASLF